VTNKNFLISVTFFLLSGALGALYLKQLPSVQHMQAVFLMANEQLIHADNCEQAAYDPWIAVQRSAFTGPCSLVFRARDIYDGVTFSKALEVFQHDLLWDQIRFAALFASFSLILMLTQGRAQRILSARNRCKQTSSPADLRAPRCPSARSKTF
jgi:hypothetical protein